jgi:hypothetical protein
MPFTLFAYEVLRNNSIFSSIPLSLASSTPIFTDYTWLPLLSVFPNTISPILVKAFIAFLIVSDEIASKCPIIL